MERLLGNEQDIEIVGAAEDGAQAVSLCSELRPDVVLMDLSMPVMGGVAATRRIVDDAGATTKVVVLTSFSDRGEVLAALDAGASGYLLKDAAPDELIRAIRSAVRGEAPLAPKAAREVLATRHEARPTGGLSERELDVLRLVAQGLPNKRVARELEISEKTVKAHLTRIFQAIGVTDRVQAILWAQQQGLT